MEGFIVRIKGNDENRGNGKEVKKDIEVGKADEKKVTKISFRENSGNCVVLWRTERLGDGRWEM